VTQKRAKTKRSAEKSPEFGVAVDHPKETGALISARAHELYVARGYEPGFDVDDWLRAEAEVIRQRINELAM
jgi:hypothetical protein